MDDFITGVANKVLEFALTEVGTQMVDKAKDELGNYIEDPSTGPQPVKNALKNIIENAIKEGGNNMLKRRSSRRDGRTATDIIESIVDLVKLDRDLVDRLQKVHRVRNTEDQQDAIVRDILMDAIEEVLNISIYEDSYGYSDIVDKIVEDSYESRTYSRNRHKDNDKYDREERRMPRKSKGDEAKYDSIIVALEKYIEENNIPFPNDAESFKTLFTRAKSISKDPDLVAFKGHTKDLYNIMRK